MALLVAILSMLSLRCDPVIDRDHVLGLVLEIEAEGLRPFDQGEFHSRVLVAVADSAEIRLLLPPPVPLQGDFLPLIAEHHKKRLHRLLPRPRKMAPRRPPIAPLTR